MILNDFEKEIIDKIIDGEITDVASFIKWNYREQVVNIVEHLGSIIDSYNNKYRLEFSARKYNDEEIKLFSGNLKHKSDIYFIDDFKPIGRFISLWHKLEKENFIISTKSILNASQLVCYMKRKEVYDFSSGINISINIKEAIESFEKSIEQQIQGLTEEEKKGIINELLSKSIKVNKDTLTYKEVVELQNDDSIKYVIKKKEKHFYLIANENLIKYVDRYIDKELIPLIDLRELRQNKYQTSSDLRFKKERNERIIAQVLTITIAASSFFLNCYISLNSGNTQKQLNKVIESSYETHEKLDKAIEKTHESQENLNKIIEKSYESQEKLNDFYLKHHKLLNQYIK